jgi:hypothetical protein
VIAARVPSHLMQRGSCSGCSRNPAGKARFSRAVHWGYGISWGAARGLLHAAGLNGGTATAAHFVALFSAEQVMLRRLHLTPPLWKSPPKETAIDALHHAVYVVATGLAYTALEKRSS